MAFTAAQAAAQVGMTKQGIIRAIHRGKLSATRNEHGNFEIEPVELFRAFPKSSIGVNSSGKVDDAQPSEAGNTVDEKVTLLERIIRDKDEVIQDLRRRLDDESEERRRLTALLEALTPPQPAAPRSWWARLLRSA